MSVFGDTIDSLRKKYEQSYGFAVFDLEAEDDGDKVILHGRVLTAKQKEEIISQIEEVSGKETEADIEVLADPRSDALGWAKVTVGLADIRSRFVPREVMNDKIAKRVRASQAAEGEILRILLEKDAQLLVQSEDLAIGWIDADMAEKGSEELRDKWRNGLVAKTDDTIAVDGTGADLIREAEKHLGVPYILGAKSETAIDCSGFTQAVFRRVFGIILPRHSWDQKKMGVAIPFEDAGTGDLIFLINKKTATRHVGILEETAGGRNLIHASLSMGGVLRQEMDKVLEEYDLVEARRIIKSA